MENNEESIFRKSSLERISSPEQLNEYIKITNPSLIVILGAVLAILITGIFLIFWGGIPEYVSLSGVAAREEYDDVQRVYCYVPISTAKRLEKGMSVQISPDYAAREKYGYIKGEVIDIGSEVITSEYLSQIFENPNIIAPALSSESLSDNLIQVKMSLNEWSSEKGQDIEITDGSLCSVSAIVDEQKAYNLIFKG